MPIFVCFDLVFSLVPDEHFLQKGAPSTALPNSEPAGLILENSAEAKQVHQKETLSVLGFRLHTVPRSFPMVFSSSFPLPLMAVVFVLSSLFHPVSLESESRDSFESTWQRMQS